MSKRVHGNKHIHRDNRKQPRDFEEAQTDGVFNTFWPCKQHQDESAEQCRHKQILSNAQQSNNNTRGSSAARIGSDRFTNDGDGFAWRNCGGVGGNGCGVLGYCEHE